MISHAKAVDLARKVIEYRAFAESATLLARRTIAEEPLYEQLADVMSKIVATIEQREHDELTVLVQLASDTVAQLRSGT